VRTCEHAHLRLRAVRASELDDEPRGAEEIDAQDDEPKAVEQGERCLRELVEGRHLSCSFRRGRYPHGTWNLLLIAVRPDRHGRGVGAALVRHVEADLSATGERILLVETSGTPRFEGTRAFYHRIGYDEEARIRKFYDAGDDKINFRKALVR